MTVGDISLGGRMLGGGLAGIAGTVAMTGPMLAARHLGLTPTLPPEVIVAKTTHLAKGAGRNAVTTVGHLGFGAVAGALIGLFPTARATPSRTVASGAAAGAAIWAASYAGWIPALGILPSPPSDHPGRRRTMVASHLVFGVVTSVIIHWMERRAVPLVPDAPAPETGALTEPVTRLDPVEEAGRESFPASDPPSWTMGR